MPWETIDARFAALIRRGHESGGERHHVPEEVAVGDAKRQGVRRAVRKPSHRKPVRVNGTASEGRGQRPIDEGDVGAIPTANDVPRLLARRGREQDQPGLVGEIAQRVETGSRVAPGSVQ